MRADQHEGDLNNTQAANAARAMEAEAQKILGQTFLLLADDDNFMLWFQRFAYPVMTQHVPEHGADLERFMGRRQLVIQIIQEMELVAPDFTMRVLNARHRYQKMIVAAGQAEEN